MIKKLGLFFVFSITILACKKNEATDIINKCVQAHGGDAYANVKTSFTFRKYRVEIEQNPTSFFYSRSTLDSASNKIMSDNLRDGKFTRKLGDSTLILSPKDEDKYKEAINSIAYFMLLPHKLLDPAVQTQYLGKVNFQNADYHKIKVSFKQEGGGKDYTDTYCYWINSKSYTLDFLAYTNGGPRFRKAKNPTTFNGVRFQDYDNFEILTELKKPEIYDSLFTAGKSKYLSEIVQTDFK